MPKSELFAEDGRPIDKRFQIFRAGGYAHGIVRSFDDLSAAIQHIETLGRDYEFQVREWGRKIVWPAN